MEKPCGAPDQSWEQNEAVPHQAGQLLRACSGLVQEYFVVANVVGFAILRGSNNQDHRTRREVVKIMPYPRADDQSRAAFFQVNDQSLFGIVECQTATSIDGKSREDRIPMCVSAAPLILSKLGQPEYARRFKSKIVRDAPRFDIVSVVIDWCIDPSAPPHDWRTIFRFHRHLPCSTLSQDRAIQSKPGRK
jgi:hypothetical protein